MRIRDKQEVYYGASLEDCRGHGSDFDPLRHDVGKPIHERSIPAERVLGEQGNALLAEWAELIRTDPAMQEQRSRAAPIGER